MIRTLSFTEAGEHQTNEDAFALFQHLLDPTAWVCFVADGQGGQRGGGPAAQLACRAATAFVEQTPPERLGEARFWSSLFRVVDEAVRADSLAGFTTFVGLCVTNTYIVGVSAGDSADLLLLKAGAVDLTTGQKKNPPVGTGMSLGVTFSATLNRPWRLLVMTDGVWKYVGWERVLTAAKREHETETVAELQRAARLPGSGLFQDDFTVVLLDGDGRVGTAG